MSLISQPQARSGIRSLRAMARRLTVWLGAKVDEKLSTQPGAVFFAKGVLDKEDDGRKVPDGASLAYIELAADLFFKQEREGADANAQHSDAGLEARLLEVFQRDVLFSCVAERYLIDRLSDPK